MRTETILKVENELERVQVAINELCIEIAKLDSEPYTTYPKSELIAKGHTVIENNQFLPLRVEGRYTAALKRASLDLTRALADLRQGR